jgi:hypothetical protein
MNELLTAWKLTESREQYDKFQGTISNLNFHAVFKYLHSLMVSDLLDSCPLFFKMYKI